MATGSTAVADIVVPRIFLPIVQQKTEEKSRLIQSGALVKDAALDGLLSGAGLTYDLPSFKPLDNEEENTSGDDTDDSYKDGFTPNTNSRPKKIGTGVEVGVRLSRNQSWAAADLAAALGQKDPMEAIADQVATYRAQRLQAAYIATMKGVFADNEAAPTATEHIVNDMTNNASTLNGGVFLEGVTSFTTEGFMDACLTMGDSSQDLRMIAIHSIVENRMAKNNLIDYIPDAINPNVKVPMFLGRVVIVDDGMPVNGNVFESWLFGASAVRLGQGNPKHAVAHERKEAAGNGGGQEVMYNRWEWLIHPTGYRYDATAAKGGPTNAATANNLAHLASWKRVYSQRKMIKIARYITRES